MIQKLDYKSLLWNKVKIALPERIRQFMTFDSNKFLVIMIGAKAGDLEDNSDALVKENVYCYDIKGDLKWKYYLGITGMEKLDEDTVVLFDGSFDNYVKVATGETIKSVFTK